jgi:transcriptional enhancer factor
MKMFPERYSSPSTSDAQSQQHGYICMSTTVDELSYTPSQEEKTRDAEQVVATGRKSWKTLKGRGEAVWPPLL